LTARLSRYWRTRSCQMSMTIVKTRGTQVASFHDWH